MEINRGIQSINWDVEEKAIFDEFNQPIKGYKRIIRNDTNKTLHVAKEQYYPVYNNQFLDMVALLKEDLGCKLTGQGVFKKGKWLYAQFENNEFANSIISNDEFGEMKGYATLANSHDGSIAFKMFKHTKSVREKLDVAYESISSIAQVQKGIYAKMNEMSERKTFDNPKDYLIKLHGYTKKPRPIKKKNPKLGVMETVGWTPPKYSGNAINNMKLYDHLYNDTYNHIAPSDWRMFNCTTHAVDHELKEHQEKNGYHILGGGNQLKVNAFNLLNR